MCSEGDQFKQPTFAMVLINHLLSFISEVLNRLLSGLNGRIMISNLIVRP